MKILVAGGAGFIGSNFLEYMMNKYNSYEFICLDNLSVKESNDNLKYLEKYKKFEFIKGDITDELFVNELFKKRKIDVVVNFAAEVAVDYSIENPNIFLRTNVIGTANLMNACLKYNIKRYHQISTDEVYGDLPLNSRKKYNENSMLKPSNPYAASKAAADMLVMSYYRTYGLRATISRSTNNYGPKQSFRALIPLTIKKTLNEEKIPVFGKGDNIRDWVFVLDHVRAIDLIIHNGEIGKIYNVAGKAKKKNIDVVKRIIKMLDKNENLIDFVEDRPGHDRMYSIDSSKIEQELGWEREYNFERGIKETLEWYAIP